MGPGLDIMSHGKAWIQKKSGSGLRNNGREKKWRAVEKITGALDVHEEGVGTLHEPLKLVPPGLRRGGRVQEILDKLQIGRRKI